MPTPQISKSDYDGYMNAAQSAIFHYQMIEQALKAYIFHAHEIVQLRMPQQLAFNYSKNEYDSMPLERLLAVYAKFTQNKPLLKQLNGLRKSRNHIAHRSFALAFLSSFDSGVSFAPEFSKVTDASANSLKAFIALKDELDSISKLNASLKEGKSAA